MNSLYPLLYVPLLGLTTLCLLGGWKLVKERRKHLRETWVKAGGAVLALALGTAGMGTMVITHARGFKAALLLVMAMNLVGLLRDKIFSNRGKATSNE